MQHIDAQRVKKLRDMTGAGFMDAKKALVATGGDIEAAVDELRKSGAAKAEKKAHREACEGLVGCAISDDNRRCALVELNCETDFVARTDDFSGLLERISQHALKEGLSDTAALIDSKMEGKSVKEHILDLAARVGENIHAGRVSLLQAGEGSFIDLYVHPGSRLLVALEFKGPSSAKPVAHDIAMQIAAAAPLAVSLDELPKEAVEREMAIFTEQAKESGKPDNIIKKIVEGRMSSFYAESALLEQQYVKDPSTTVREHLEAEMKRLGADLGVVRFVRFEVGAA